MSSSSEGPVSLTPGEKQLFVDDHVIDVTRDLTRSLHQPQRHPENPILVGDEPWEYWTAYPNGRAVIYDEEENCFKMWYLSALVDEEYAQNIHYRVLYAESEDGIHWEKPNLGLVEWEGSTDNNLLPWGENWMRRPTLLPRNTTDRRLT
jgi:hypothetical protein